MSEKKSMTDEWKKLGIPSFPRRRESRSVIPAQAGIQMSYAADWMPACAGTTNRKVKLFRSLS